MSRHSGNELTDEFSRIAFKKLTAVETDPERSNQHEFNGSRALKHIFGPDTRKVSCPFLWLSDDGSAERADGFLTWYDARANHPTRSEYRLYYQGNAVTRLAREGYFLLIGLRRDSTVLVVLTPGSGVAATTIYSLFGIETEPGAVFSSLGFSDTPIEEGDQYLSAWASDEASLGGTHDEEIIASAVALQSNISRKSTASISALEASGSWADGDILRYLLSSRAEVPQ